VPRRPKGGVEITSALDVGGLSMSCSGRFTPWKESRYPFIGSWVGPRAGLDGWGSFTHQDSIPWPSSP